jgi:DNA polymerase-3 subunit gamma/tau
MGYTFPRFSHFTAELFDPIPMSYQVLARKWRPRLFRDLVGQEHVVQALVNALDHDLLHHAYLFTGTRGVGKTTLARIFAKSLNCEQGVSATPCGECSSCREIDEGRFTDLLEVDAASRTKVDQTRELLENVPYAPVRGRYKVYLIDEVHMFSDSSFNALLKTLEEPPPHVKFLLATTDPQKVPVTVLSRCLQFNLKRLTLDQIRERLKLVLEQEEIAAEAPALVLLARAADGSMRDALSLLDQAIAFGGGEVKEADVRSMLGTVAGEQVQHLLEALASMDATAVMSQVAELAERVPDFAGVLQELLALLHRVALYQAVPEALDSSLDDREWLADLAGRVSPEDVQLFYQIGLVGQRDLPLAPDPRSGFEMVLLRMLTFRPAESGTAPATPPTRRAPAPKTETPKGGTAQPTKTDPAPAAPVSDPPPAAGTVPPSDWHRMVAVLDLGGIARQLASNCLYESWDGERLVLKLDPVHKHMRVESSEHRLRRALEEYLGCRVQLDIRVSKPEAETPAEREARQRTERQQQAENALATDPLVQAMGEQFGAKLVPGSVRPADDS